MPMILKANANKSRIISCIKHSKEYENGCYVCSDYDRMNNDTVDFYFDKDILQDGVIKDKIDEVYEIFVNIQEQIMSYKGHLSLLIIYTNYIEEDISILKWLANKFEKENYVSVIIACKDLYPW